jgi:glycosyltransferase involved in cell wall biosynthesis
MRIRVKYTQALSTHFPQVQDLSVCVVLPAYHAEKTLEATLQRLPQGACQDIILVDDASTDNTIDVARQLGITVHRHPVNRGYGGNQKTCYRLALETNADVIVMLHPDNQYDGALVPFMTGFIKAGVVDIVLGSRIRRREEVLAGGMPPIKYVANRLLTILENVVLGLNLPEYHTGYRAYHRRVLESVNFEACSDDFVFDQQFLVQARVQGLRIGSVPVPTHYGPESSSIPIGRSTKYAFGTLMALARYVLYRAGWKSQRLFQPRASISEPQSERVHSTAL